MKTIITAIIIALSTLTASAQRTTVKPHHRIDTEAFGRTKRHTLPLNYIYMSNNTAEPIPITNHSVEITSEDNRNNGMAVRIKVYQEKTLVRVISSASKDTRLIQQQGYIALVTDNFIVAELTYEYDKGWILNPYVRNAAGRGEALIDNNSYRIE